MRRKLIPKSRLTEQTELDSVKRDRANNDRTYFDILLQAQYCWNNLDSFRKERDRNKKYTYGDQWSDYITGDDGKQIKESDYIKSQGSVPLKNNLIRRLVRTVMGVYRGQSKEPTCTARDRDEQRLGETMSIALQCNYQLNRMQEVNGRTFEEFLISGAAFQKESYGWRNNKMDCWTDIVSSNHIFFDSAMKDVRHWDCSFIGEIHDITFEELCAQFAKGPNDYQKLKDIYTRASNREYLQSFAEKFGKGRLENIDFLNPYDITMCRVIEVWRKEQKPRFRCHDYLNGDYYKDEISNEKNIIAENNSRIREGLEAGMDKDEIPLIEYEWFMDDYWYFRFLTPFGQVLSEGETPFKHKSHPYVLKLYPFIDGEVHSFVADVIDQQRYVNRLIMLNDWIIKSSAKGVLLFPEEMLPEDMTMEDVAEEWARFDGVIAYKPKPGTVAPQQIASNSTNIGTHEMLQLQMNLMEDVTGVTGALQGKPGYSGTSAALYSQQMQNASSSLLDLLESFSGFVIDGAIKKVKNMQQFYDSKRILNIVGKNSGALIEYDPDKISDVEFDLSITESTNTPVYRSMANDFLMEIWKAGQIGIEQLLQCGDFPFADELLQSLQSQKEQMEQGQVPQGLPDNLKQQISQGADPRAAGMIRPTQQPQ